MKRSAYTFYKWLGFTLAAIVSGIGAILGWVEGVPLQHVIFYSAATFALILWGWHHFSIRWIYGSDEIALQTTKDDSIDLGEDEVPTKEASGRVFLKNLITRNKGIVIGLFLLLALFIIISLSVDEFFTPTNVFTSLVMTVFLVFAIILNKYVRENKSAFIGITVLIGLFIMGSLVVDGFFSTINLKSMLVFAAFLGLASLGQTLVVLLGGLDLSIPFVIGAANIALMYLFGFEILPTWVSVIIILLIGAAIGFVNGILTFRLQEQALILTLGVGFAVAGGAQILTSIGTRYAGNVHGAVPDWLTNIAAMNGTTLGLQFPPVIVIWIVVAVLLIVAMRNTIYGRRLYALGGNRIASKRLSIPERRYWVGVYTISGFIAAMTGELLLGWSGSGFIGVGDPYLFMTLAAVVIGGTSLLGGWGGYGFTVIGVLVLQVLTSFLVGIGLDYEGQQFVFGLLIIPMVALYARSPHIRTQI
jgi:ribose transport system permease protein